LYSLECAGSSPAPGTF